MRPGTRVSSDIPMCTGREHYPAPTVRPSYQQGLARYLQRVRAALHFDAGKVAPPADRAKRSFLLQLFNERNHALFVESGTFLGGTVD